MASSVFGVRRHHRNIQDTSPSCLRMQLEIKTWIMSNTVSADSIKAQMRHPLFPVLGVTTRDIWDSSKIQPSTWCATEERSTYQQRNPNLPQHAKRRHCPPTRRTIGTTATNLAARKAWTTHKYMSYNMSPLMARALGLPCRPCAGPGQLIAGDYYILLFWSSYLMLFDVDFCTWLSGNCFGVAKSRFTVLESPSTPIIVQTTVYTGV